MSIHKSVVKNRFGGFYKLQLPRENNAQLTLKAETFWNEESTQQFINNLTVPNGYWREIVNEYSTMPSTATLTNQQIEQKVADLMVQDKLKIYPVDLPDIVEHPPEKRILKGSDDILYRFSSISSLLLNNAAETKKFKNAKEAANFISQLNPSNEQLTTISSELKITIPTTAILNPIEVTNSTAQELASENVVVIIDKTSSAPPTIKEELNKSDIGNRAIALTGESNTEDSKAKNICSCSINNLKSTCSHNRTSDLNNILQIVASPIKAKTEEYELMGIKVMLKKEYSGTDNVSCEASFENNQSTGCFQITDIDKKYITSNISELEFESKENETSSRWPINASPKKLTVSGHGCDNKIKTTKIEQFPNQYFTVEANVSIFQDWVKNVNKAWEDWGSKIFNLSPVDIIPKLTGPTGSFSANWGWKEDNNWQSYYNVSTNFGLNPIFGVEIKIIISMAKLALTAAGIPPTLTNLAADHLADVQLSAAANCKGTLIGSPIAKFYSDGTNKHEGEGKFTVEGGVILEILGRVGSDYIISAELSVSGETKVAAEDLLMLNREGVYLQSTIMMSPLIGVAKVKIRYLKIRTKTKEKKWEPWQKIELYKSENTKILPRS